MAIPIIAIAIWLAMALYYKALFDVAVLALLLATAFSLGAFFRPRRDTRSAETLGFRLCIGIGVLAMLVWLSTFKNYHYRELYLAVSIASIIWQRKKLWRAVRQISNSRSTCWRGRWTTTLRGGAWSFHLPEPKDFRISGSLAQCSRICAGNSVKSRGPDVPDMLP